MDAVEHTVVPEKHRQMATLGRVSQFGLLLAGGSSMPLLGSWVRTAVAGAEDMLHADDAGSGASLCKNLIWSPEEETSTTFTVLYGRCALLFGSMGTELGAFPLSYAPAFFNFLL